MNLSSSGTISSPASRAPRSSGDRFPCELPDLDRLQALVPLEGLEADPLSLSCVPCAGLDRVPEPGTFERPGHIYSRNTNPTVELLEPGDRVVSVRDSYGGTNRLFVEFLPRLGIDVEVVDLRRLADAAHEVGATVVVDNTFATPINQLPLDLGADLALHSATKFLGGHSDAIGGVVCWPSRAVASRGRTLDRLILRHRRR